MKNAILTILMIAGFQVFADTGTKLICKETSVPAGQPALTMVLTQLDGEEVHEGGRYDFNFELYDASGMKPEVSVPVVVTEKDVMVSFASDDGKLMGILFKDELDQTAVHFEGQDIGFDCNVSI